MATVKRNDKVRFTAMEVGQIGAHVGPCEFGFVPLVEEDFVPAELLRQRFGHPLLTNSPFSPANDSATRKRFSSFDYSMDFCAYCNSMAINTPRSSSMSNPL